MTKLRFRIGTKVAISAGVGVLLVTGMLAAQQLGQRSVAQENAAAEDQQAVAVSALGAAGLLRTMQIQLREMRLAIAASEMDQAMERLRASAAEAVRQLEAAERLTGQPDNRERFRQLIALANAYSGVAAEMVAAQKDYQDTVEKVQRAGKISKEMDELTDQATAAATRLAAERKAKAADEATAASRIGLAIGIAVIALLAGAAAFGLLSIARPIRRIGEVLLVLGGGDKSADIPYVGRGDEVGDAARAALTFKQHLTRLEQMEADQQRLQAQAAEQRRHEMHRLADGFEAEVSKILGTVSSAGDRLETAARTLTTTAEETQSLSSTVASASEQASANVHSVASAAAELTGSVEAIGRHVQESSRIAGEAVRQAERTDGRIAKLSEAAARIGDVVKLITAIAEQTNLLALNATIEAARAGEAGKGFAVVAQEVKALAAQTAKATDEIGTQIAAMQAATNDSVSAIKEIGATIGRIAEIASAVASAVEEQGATTQGIARNVGEAARGTAQVAAHIVDVNRGAGATGAASEQVLASAHSLATESNHLRRAVESFVQSVRAA